MTVPKIYSQSKLLGLLTHEKRAELSAFVIVLAKASQQVFSSSTVALFSFKKQSDAKLAMFYPLFNSLSTQ